MPDNNNGWRPIETAPKDGTRVLVWNDYMGPYSSEYVDGYWPLGLHDGEFGVWYPSPSKWMPLPDGPEDVVLHEWSFAFPSARWLKVARDGRTESGEP